MQYSAFCPAHITGFFKASLDDRAAPEEIGSMGAGFSIKTGVTTHVEVMPRTAQQNDYHITLQGHPPDRTNVSEMVLEEFLSRVDHDELYINVIHDIGVPVGYGLGASGAVALSLSYALDRALGTRLDQAMIGMIAHNAEVKCRTGLGDVLASYHGGFEIRTAPGAPGVGSLEKISAEPTQVIIICFAPVPTSGFIAGKLPDINGIGGGMVEQLLETQSYDHFQDMSVEFARQIGMITPRMIQLIDELARLGIKCGVAMVGETIFCMVQPKTEDTILKVLAKYINGTIIRTEIDGRGARLIRG